MAVLLKGHCETPLWMIGGYDIREKPGLRLLYSNTFASILLSYSAILAYSEHARYWLEVIPQKAKFSAHIVHCNEQITL